ncbi:IS630 family transposase [Solibacillus silvestris]|uniref:IS630 family transposase n=1 Tax=Solibacillus silvestris TaxID=76853 RepID=UPI003F7F3A7F
MRKKLLDEEIDHLFFEDESTIRDYQALQYNWFLKGQQRKIPTHGRHEGAKLFAAIHYATGHIIHREEETADAQAFQRFLQDILTAYPEGKIVIMLDNARIHHAKAIQPFLKENSRLQFVFLPPYSPELNMAEGLWDWLKKDVINNVFFQKFYHIKRNVKEFMDWANNMPCQVIDRLLVKY